MNDIGFAKFVLFVNALVPGGLLLWDVCHGQAGANPTNYALRTTGILTVTFLCLSLAVTPLRRITGVTQVFHFRRLLGLYAVSYALVHFSIFFVFDRALSVQDTLSEMVKRPYLIVGSTGLIAMLPLAATSTNAMIRRLGPTRWRALHRLAYFAAIVGVVHFYMLVKSDTRKPIAYGEVVAVLLGYRLAVFGTTFVRRKLQSAADIPGSVSMDAQRWSGKLKVERIVEETPDVRTFRLVPAAGGELPFSYAPGQYLTLTSTVGGKTVRRSYTIASTPTRAAFCEISVKREERGLFSRHLHDTVGQGEELSVSAPAGRFTFDGTGSASVALLAAGVGITPLMSMVRYLTDRRWSGQVHLIYSSRTERDIVFRDELADLERRFPNLHVTLTLTRAEGSTWTGFRGRIDADLLRRSLPDLARMPFYLCGPQEMLTATRLVLGQLGVPERSVHTESFGPAAIPGSATANDGPGFTVTFSRSNRSATIDGSRPILSLAEEMGIPIESECRSGICGRCKCRLEAGSVSQLSEEALDEDDRRDNVILLCQARALENVTLDA